MYTNILIPMDPDYTDNFDPLVKLALKVIEEGGTISTLYVNKNYIHHAMAATSPDKPTEIEKAILETVINKFEATVPEDVRGRVYTQRGVVHDEILRVSKRMQADLIIMSPNKRPWLDRFMGSNTRKVMTEAHCSVFVRR
ncbi:universal stress protein [Marinobacterium sp. AK62]|uniref:Universal stress protein n=1 Tax=Marinobacterium alkalitolerans TaxID=1542925 RepID=A0ABS3Z6R0_9GAMM|nr:universal stress protein [Marinobacterium alkalitolerans]MBP0047396.1 universal stress protein [Marinobacterium alkalitolerans]